MSRCETVTEVVLISQSFETDLSPADGILVRSGPYQESPRCARASKTRARKDALRKRYPAISDQAESADRTCIQVILLFQILHQVSQTKRCDKARHTPERTTPWVQRFARWGRSINNARCKQWHWQVKIYKGDRQNIWSLPHCTDFIAFCGWHLSYGMPRARFSKRCMSGIHW